MEDKNIQIGGGKRNYENADFIISIQKTPADRENSKIKIVRSKFTPSK